MSEMKVFSISKKGRRNYNQDAQITLQVNEHTWFFAVADGMGGTEGGEIASQTTIEAAKTIVTKAFESTKSVPVLKEVLRDIIALAHKNINSKKKEENRLAGMGTTLTCLLVNEKACAWANIGDSRIYRLRDGEIEQLTEDHTYVQDYINEHGSISENLASQYAHYILKVIDGQNQAPDLFPQKSDTESIKEGDVFLLCSDGLITDKVHTNTNLIKNYLIGTNDLEDAGNSLYHAAYHAGSDDNITVVLAEFGTLKRKKLKLRRYDDDGNIIKEEVRKTKKTFLQRIFGFFT